METPGRWPGPGNVDGLIKPVLKEFPITSTQSRRENNSGHRGVKGGNSKHGGGKLQLLSPWEHWSKGEGEGLRRCKRLAIGSSRPVLQNPDCLLGTAGSFVRTDPGPSSTLGYAALCSL